MFSYDKAHSEDRCQAMYRFGDTDILFDVDELNDLYLEIEKLLDQNGINHCDSCSYAP
jgi:hypothetical protein